MTNEMKYGKIKKLFALLNYIHKLYQSKTWLFPALPTAEHDLLQVIYCASSFPGCLKNIKHIRSCQCLLHANITSSLSSARQKISSPHKRFLTLLCQYVTLTFTMNRQSQYWHFNIWNQLLVNMVSY